MNKVLSTLISIIAGACLVISVAFKEMFPQNITDIMRVLGYVLLAVIVVSRLRPPKDEEEAEAEE